MADLILSAEDGEDAAEKRCPFCRAELEGDPNRCPECGRIIGESAEDIKREGASARRSGHRRKTFADLVFLAGLVVGGPLVSMTDHTRLGLFVVLAGGLSSAVHRYFGMSQPATLLVASLSAAVLAVAVTDPADSPGAEGDEASEVARGAYLSALATDLEPLGGSVEGRGPGLAVAWFYLPADDVGECGSYPPAEERQHLADLGFQRIVIANETDGPGICTFSP